MAYRRGYASCECRMLAYSCVQAQPEQILMSLCQAHAERGREGQKEFNIKKRQ